MLTPVMFDCNHDNDIDWDAVATWAWGCSLKVAQGLGMTDHTFASRRAEAEKRGILVGGYDFSTDDDVAANVTRYLGLLSPGPQTQAELDFEDLARHAMSGDQAWEWLDRVNQRMGRAATLYGGNRIREHIRSQDKKWIDMAAVTPLWLCQYKNVQADTLNELDRHISVPPPWKRWTYLQYAADGAGPAPHKMPGVENKADLNVYRGDRAAFAAGWPGQALPAPEAVA
jgi:GH25 family lysozyme M1 (1,4-beta-N-acetylmuramidase)